MNDIHSHGMLLFLATMSFVEYVKAKTAASEKVLALQSLNTILKATLNNIFFVISKARI